MIFNPVLRLLWAIVSPILAKIPPVNINYDGVVTSSVYQYIRAALYFFPMQTVVNILSIVLALWVLRVIIALLHSLWASLPIVERKTIPALSRGDGRLGSFGIVCRINFCACASVRSRWSFKYCSAIDAFARC